MTCHVCGCNCLELIMERLEKQAQELREAAKKLDKEQAKCKAVQA